MSRNCILGSCPWGPVTANGLNEMYVIYMERDGRRACDTRKEGRKEGRTDGKLGNI